jgi:hypothetical protein
VTSPSAGLAPVHIGQHEPGSEQEQMSLAMQREFGAGRTDRGPRVPGDLDWERHGLQPRWLGMETSDCAIAIEPGFFHNGGADERDRCRRRSARRTGSGGDGDW